MRSPEIVAVDVVVMMSMFGLMAMGMIVRVSMPVLLLG
jgi:hypothetical protein